MLNMLAVSPVLGLAATVIVLVSLWPLRLVSERLEVLALRRLHVRVQVQDAARLSDLFDWLAERHVDIIHFDSERDEAGRHILDLVLGLPGRTDRDRLTTDLGGLDWIALGDVGHRHE